MLATSIYVLPTTSNMPPRAIIGLAEAKEGEEPEAPSEGDTITGVMAIWTGDVGCWTLNGIPVQPDLNEAISAHARALEVPGF